MTEDNKVAVEPVDRERAAEYTSAVFPDEIAILAEIMARHRLAERERIVAWLRGGHPDWIASAYDTNPHGGQAMSAWDAGELWQPDPRTVRACIEALPQEFNDTSREAVGCNDGISRCRKSLEALLPKPDRAKVLVEQYRQTFKNPDIVATHMDDETAFAEWLISTGRLQP